MPIVTIVCLISQIFWKNEIVVPNEGELWLFYYYSWKGGAGLSLNKERFFFLLFSFQTSREKFDCDVRKMMTREQVHLHNEFLLCLFNKVQGLASSAPLRPVKLSNNVNNSNAEKPKSFKEKRLGLKRQYKSDKSIYEVSYFVINYIQV